MADALGLHREMIELVERRDFDRLRDLYAADYEYWSNDGTAGGIDAAIEVAQTYTSAFPDMKFEIVHETSCGDVSVVEFVARGTHKGELAGIAATGKTAEVAVCNIIEVADGKIRREREYFDQLSMMQQLGVIPTEG
jgi:steroid delta-isomerase-like uncharacterized protein